MSVGERIKRVRKFRGMTQAQLGEAVGLSDVRIRQYELGNRTPKEDTLNKIAEALNVNYRSLYEPSLYAAEDVMFSLFELDEHYDMPIYEVTGKEVTQMTHDDDNGEKHVCVSFGYSLLDDFLMEWLQKKQELKQGKITREEYLEWKLKWPDSTV